jgi:thiamine-phosphate diphosphorylase
VTAFRRRSLTLVTDRRRLAPDARTTAGEVRALESCLDVAIDAGIDYVQIRETGLGSHALVEIVQGASARAQGTATRVLVNDRADVALVAGAHGVHLKADGASVARTRLLAGDWLVGQSVHQSGVPADSAGADYLLFGAVFPTSSKPAGHRAAGLDALARVAATAGPPIVAIGGITPDNAALAAAAGAAGVAAIGVFLPEGRAPGALGVRRAVEQFRAIAAFRTDLLE